MTVEFPPTRAAALDRLTEFVPRAGRDYAAQRNYDRSGHKDVSRLSPYIRRRLISESEVLEAVLSRHTPAAAGKYIQEVFWRTYWKGWLEMRPDLWKDYLAGRNSALNRIQTEDGLRSGWERACLGKTEIDCLNNWSQELVSTGYLHNHARMWFASIWIFTLRLPWELGADFFLRHLLDGDPASNTLSWRWVAGLQTKGKTYLARPDNIQRYTEGRFRPEPGTLASFAPALDGRDFERLDVPQSDPIEPRLKTGILVHDDDLDLAALKESHPDASLCRISSLSATDHVRFSPQVVDFVENCLSNSMSEETTHNAQIIQNVADWAKENSLEQVITNYATVGPARDMLEQVDLRLKASGIRLTQSIKPYDQACWPHATHGFFRFKDKIPRLIEQLGLDQGGAGARQGDLFG